jgi:hypothetical protein
MCGVKVTKNDAPGHENTLSDHKRSILDFLTVIQPTLHEEQCDLAK